MGVVCVAPGIRPIPGTISAGAVQFNRRPMRQSTRPYSPLNPRCRSWVPGLLLPCFPMVFRDLSYCRACLGRALWGASLSPLPLIRAWFGNARVNSAVLSGVWKSRFACDPATIIEEMRVLTNQRRSFAIAIVFCLIALTFAARTSGFENIRAVQILLLFVAGMNGGVALMILRTSMKKNP